jgi:autotransporter-associated beta strand protein
MTIGNGATGYDSIASENSTAIINKTGAGSLVVNSSMQYFTGALNVNDGTMEANKGLGAKAINIANGAILGLQINGNNTLSNSSLVFTNNGTLILTSKVGLAEGDYTVSVANIADYGTTKTYGGILTGNTFTVASAKQIAVGSEISINVVNNGIVEVKSAEETTVAMTFNSANATVNKVLEATNTLSEFVQSTGADFTKISAFEFDVDMAEGDTVVLSFFVGDSSLTVSDFSIFHKTDGGQWSNADDISNVSYDGEFLSFVVSHFSSYGYTAVPEPSTYAMIFGAIALGFIAYRRRK